MDKVPGLIGVGEIGEGLGHSMEAEGVKLIEGGMSEHVGVLLNGSNGARGCWHGGSERCPRGAWARPPIELGVEDGFDGTVGPGADFDGVLRGGLDARRSIGADETHDAETRRTMPRQER